MEYCSTCGSIKKDDGMCSNRNCLGSGIKRRGWMVNGVFLDFAKPVTVEEANEAYERINAVGGE